MAYRDFTLTKVKQQLGLTVNESQNLFTQVNPVQPSEFLSLTLREYLSLATAVIYGAVTSGTNWRFLTLSRSLVYIDSNEYFINEVDKNLGILLQPFQPALTAF